MKTFIIAVICVRIFVFNPAFDSVSAIAQQMQDWLSGKKVIYMTQSQNEHGVVIGILAETI